MRRATRAFCILEKVTGRVRIEARGGVPLKVIDVQPTPNPNAMKFVLDAPITPTAVSFFNAAAAKGHGLGERLFAIEGVASVLLLGDFVTVNKASEAKWGPMMAAVKKVLQSS